VTGRIWYAKVDTDGNPVFFNSTGPTAAGTDLYVYTSALSNQFEEYYIGGGCVQTMTGQRVFMNDRRPSGSVPCVVLTSFPHPLN